MSCSPRAGDAPQMGDFYDNLTNCCPHARG